MDRATILKVVGGLGAVGLTVGIVSAAQAQDSTTTPRRRPRSRGTAAATRRR